MLMEVPDAPWIREAETNGMPDAETVYCPVCGAEDPEDFVLDDGGDVIGCDCCLRRVDPWRYMADKKAGVRRVY